MGCTHYLRLSLAVVHVPGPLASWDLQCTFSFTLTAPWITLLGSACRDSEPATHCLASPVFLWNLDGSIHEPVILAFCMSAKPESHHMDKVKTWHHLKQKLSPLGPWLQWPPSTWAAKHGERNPGKTTSKVAQFQHLPVSTLFLRQSFKGVYPFFVTLPWMRSGLSTHLSYCSSTEFMIFSFCQL
jgi:hypothetical protein